MKRSIPEGNDSMTRRMPSNGIPSNGMLTRPSSSVSTGSVIASVNGMAIWKGTPLIGLSSHSSAEALPT